MLLSVVVIIAQEEESPRSSRKIQAVDSESYVGRIVPSERKTWIDETSKYEITQWTSKGESTHPYFTNESFIDDDAALIFSERTGKKQLYKLNLVNGEMIQMTNAEHFRSMDFLIKKKMLWYLDGKVLMSLDVQTLESEEIYNFEKWPYTIGSFTVTCDAKFFVFSSNQKQQAPDDCGYGPYVIYRLNLSDKSIIPLTHITGFNIGHLQANPVDPTLILYCWQWEALGRKKLVGDTPIRIWWVNIDGTDGGPFQQPFGLHRTHESWTPDGKYVTYSGDFRFGLQKGREVLGLQSIDGSVNKMYDATVWHAHQNLFKDNKHWIADKFKHDERDLVMFTRGEDKMEKTEILFHHASSWDGQGSHPHPRFSPNGKYILFSTDRTGNPQVYSVKVNLKITNEN
jgi:oligogalacturonide lyase